MKRLAVRSAGQGPDLVLLHGWGLHGGIWDCLVGKLQDDFTCHAVDLPGHGHSPSGWRGLNNWSDAVAGVMPERATVIGWSLGSLVAMNLALRHEQLVERLILISATPRFLQSADWPYGQRPASLRSMGEGLEQDFVSTLHEFLVLQMLGQPGARILLRELRQSLLDRPPQVAGLHAGLDILQETDLRERAADIGHKTLVVAGERDRLTHPEAGRTLAGIMPQAEFWLVPKSAHAPFISHQEACAERIRAFAG